MDGFLANLDTFGFKLNTLNLKWMSSEKQKSKQILMTRNLLFSTIYKPAS